MWKRIKRVRERKKNKRIKREMRKCSIVNVVKLFFLLRFSSWVGGRLELFCGKYKGTQNMEGVVIDDCVFTA